MDTDTLIFPRRFNGPPRSANGGYACGRIAGLLAGKNGGDAVVTLRVPPPLDTPLEFRRNGEQVEALWDDRLVGVGVATTLGTLDIPVPTVEEARSATQRTFADDRHPLPSCFVCGPHREAGDGLRIHAGPIDADDRDWHGVVAAPWTPDESLVDRDGYVRSEFLWAALDCPTAYAGSSSAGMRCVLLGRQAVSIHERPRVGTPLVVAARERAVEGRKRFAEAILATETGQVIADCRATWIEVSEDVLKGATGG